MGLTRENKKLLLRYYYAAATTRTGPKEHFVVSRYGSLRRAPKVFSSCVFSFGLWEGEEKGSKEEAKEREDFISQLSV